MWKEEEQVYRLMWKEEEQVHKWIVVVCRLMLMVLWTKKKKKLLQLQPWMEVCWLALLG
jgi:hypothetical protein